MHHSMKVAALPQNPQLINQVEQFLIESNGLIRDSQYRKCILLLDSHYKKLLPVDSPLQLRIKVLRRLNYCTVMYFKLKINKADINAKKSQYLLWSRLLLYLRDFHDHIQMMKVKIQKRFYTQELISIVIKGLQYRSFYYQKNTLAAKGLLHFHSLTQTVAQQLLLEKIPIFLTQLGQYFSSYRKLHIISGNTYFQLQNYTVAQQYYSKALECYQKNIEIVYNEILMTTQEQTRLTMKLYTREIILTLFLLALVYEQMNDFIKYQESIKIMSWFDFHYQPENSFTKVYLYQYVDQTKYVLQAVEIMEIIKVLKIAVPEEETIKPSGEEDQLNYFNNMLYEFDEFRNIKRSYYYYDKSSFAFQTEQIESETQLDKLAQSRITKTNTQGIHKSMQIDSESTAIGKSLQLRTKTSENGLSTRFQTESETQYTQPSVQRIKRPNIKKSQNKEDITLQEYYGKTIEKSVKLSEINTMTEQHNEELIVEQEETVHFEKILHQSKQQIQFRRLFGSIGMQSNDFEYPTRESKKREIKQSQKHISLMDTIITQQIKMKTKTESTTLLDQYNLQRKMCSAPNLFQKIHSHRSNKPAENLITQKATIDQPRQTERKAEDEENLIKEIKINTKETIKKMMDEKEQMINSKRFSQRKVSSSNTAKNNTLLELLIVRNNALAHTTDQISSSKKVHSLKSLLEAPRNGPNGKRMTAILQVASPRTQPKTNSHQILPNC